MTPWPSQGVSSIDVQLEEGVVGVDHDTSVTAERSIHIVQSAGYAAALRSRS